jgi:DNA-binding PadR family transcriptional regulator
MTGKEIITHADNESEGDWAPSPGLIYPLLGRLVRDGFIMELDHGKYTTTEKGNDTLKQYSKMQDQLERQFELINKLGISVYTTSKFIAVEALDRINNITSTMRTRVSKRSHEVQENFDAMYEDFLKRELDKLNQKKNMKTDRSNV